MVDNCKTFGLIKWKDGVETKLMKTFRGWSVRDGGVGIRISESEIKKGLAI